jgi:hypothetical protein
MAALEAIVLQAGCSDAFAPLPQARRQREQQAAEQSLVCGASAP